MIEAILCTWVNRSNIRINFEWKSEITQHANEVSSTYQICCFNACLHYIL